MRKRSNIWFIFSVILAVLVCVSSISGILISQVYSQETPNWALQAIGQDVGNLLAVPLIVVSAFFVQRRSIKALLLFIGTLLYFIYAYLIYSFFIHFNFLFLVYVVILGLSFYILVGSIIQQDVENLSIARKIPNSKFAAIVLFTTGALFGLLWLSEIIPALFLGQEPRSLKDTGLWVNPIQVIDLALVLPGMSITAILVLKNHWLGNLFAAPWLIFSVLMGSSIIVTMLLELSNGNVQAIVPIFMVGLLVLASLVTLLRYVKKL